VTEETNDNPGSTEPGTAVTPHARMTALFQTPPRTVAEGRRAVGLPDRAATFSALVEVCLDGVMAQDDRAAQQFYSFNGSSVLGTATRDRAALLEKVLVYAETNGVEPVATADPNKVFASICAKASNVRRGAGVTRHRR
jgi:hypothetical protein